MGGWGGQGVLKWSTLIRLVLLGGEESSGLYEDIVDRTLNGYPGNPGLLMLYENVYSPCVCPMRK